MLWEFYQEYSNQEIRTQEYTAVICMAEHSLTFFPLELPPTMKGSMVNLKPSDVLHIPGLGFDGLVGYSPIAMAKNANGMAIACEEYGAKFFANGATPGGILEHPGTVKDPQRVRDSWTSAFGGSSNANKVAVLEEGMKYTPISISPEQAQFLETRKFQINEIARIFRVPPHMVGDLEKSSFSNIEQQSLEFVKYTLDPWVARWEQAIVLSLFSTDEKTQYFFKFPDIISTHPTVLSANGITIHTALIIATEQPIHIELDKVLCFLIRRK